MTVCTRIRARIAGSNASPLFMGSREFTKWLEGEYNASRAALIDLGYAK